MTESQNCSRPNPDSLELAAAIAAVTAFLKTEVDQPAPKIAPVSGWRKAALLEGTNSRMPDRHTSSHSVWRTALSLAALAAASLTAPAFSIDNQINNYQLAYGGANTSASSMSAGVNNVPHQANERIVADDATLPTVAMKSNGSSGFSLQQPENSFIRIGLAIANRSVQIETPDGAYVTGGGTDGSVAILPSHSRWTLSASKTGTIAFQGQSSRDVAKMATNSGQASRAAYAPSTAPMSSKFNVSPELQAVVAQNGGYLIVPTGSDYGAQIISCNGKLYRGALWIRSTPGSGQTVDVINILDVEDYILSVLPSEMPATWPAEALQAQAIAARSYAIANMGKHGRDGYDLKANIEDQVYLGISSERQSSNDAVAATNRLVLKHAGKAISAFFHSTSGGATEVSENVWGRPLPYLKSVIDYDDQSPHFAWTRKVTIEEIEKAFGQDIGKCTSVAITSRSQTSNRVSSVLFTGTTGTKVVSGDNLRMYLKLPSSNFNVGCEENGYTFAGRGFGHGLGMSQYGAKALAEQGYNAAQILAYYYKDVSVEYVAGPPGI